MKILIIGGTRLIGPWVIKGLLHDKHQITVFNRGQTKANLTPEVNRIYGDRRHLTNYLKELRKLAPEVVIDMMAMTETNAQQLIEVFSTTAYRLIVISSGDVYKAHEKICQPYSDVYEPMPLYENSELRQHVFPYRQYAKGTEDMFYYYDKSMVEKVIHNAPIHSTILRLPFVYGPGDLSRLLPYLKNIQEHQEIILDKNKAKWRSTRGYVEDVAAAIIKATLDERDGKFIYNVGEPEALTEKQWITEIANILDWKNKIIEKDKDDLPENLREPYDWHQDIVYDTSKIRNELRYQEKYSRNEALKKSIEWALTNMTKESV